jgi:dihydroxyacetone kinase-like protein
MPKESLDAAGTVAMLVAAADAVIAAEPELTDADRRLGDGDHGLGMQRGMGAAKEKLAAGGIATPGQAFTAVGTAMMTSMGGASGAVFGTLFRNGGKAVAGDTFDAGALATFLRAGLDGVVARGGAKPGDKTMVDALAPAAEAARAAADEGQPLHAAAAAAANAAESGRDASASMVATLGRARTLGERSVGHPDAGACSVAIILRATSQFLAS